MTTPLGTHYAGARERMGALLRAEGPDAFSVPVAACPGWDVHAVIGHLVGVIEDVNAGRLSGPPDDAQTAEQVQRHRDDDPVALLAAWDALAPPFEDLVTQASIWPAVMDVTSHEHDVRAALDRPGGRDAPVVALAARTLVASSRFSRPLRIDLGPDGEVISRTADDDDRAPLVLTTTAFELLRLRLGRRSRAQVAALAWSEDPGPVLDELFVFGPAADDIVE